MIAVPYETALPETRGYDTRLARLVQAYAPHDGTFDVRVPGLHVSRASRPSRESYHTMYFPSLCVVAQGAKAVSVGTELYEYDASRMLVVSVALPVSTRVTQATDGAPYLSIRLDLDPRRIAEFVPRVFPSGLPHVPGRRAAYIAPVDVRAVDAVARLLECLATPGDAELIGPMVVDEMLMRLLRGPVGAHVAEMGLVDSGVQRVAKAVSWLRDNFAQSVRVEELAALVHMSVSSFHNHFKSVTSMSPLQYQKALRLQEARRLLLFTPTQAGAACRQVGYSSASQFSRDYRRFFGSPPSRDIARLRRQMAIIV